MPNLIVWRDRSFVTFALKLCVVGAMTRSLKVSCPSDEKAVDVEAREFERVGHRFDDVVGKPSCVKSKPAENGVRFDVAAVQPVARVQEERRIDGIDVCLIERLRAVLSTGPALFGVARLP